MWWLFGLLTAAAALAWLRRRPHTRDADPDARDPDVLAAAEREVRDLPSLRTPDDADDDLTDWGPGAPRS